MSVVLSQPNWEEKPSWLIHCKANENQTRDWNQKGCMLKGKTKLSNGNYSLKRTGSLKLTKSMWEKHHTECVFGDNNLTFIYSTFQPDGLQSASQALVLVQMKCKDSLLFPLLEIYLCWMNHCNCKKCIVSRNSFIYICRQTSWQNSTIQIFP